MTYKKTVVAFLDLLGTRDNQDFESKYKVHRAFHESMRDCQSRDRGDASYYRKIFSFSDCAYIFHGFREGAVESPEAEDLLIQAALFNTTLTILRLLNDGYLVRGGICFGEAYLDDLSFFGPAVEEAYFLESKQAIVPRILISNKLGERARTFSVRAHQECYSEDSPNFGLLPRRTYLPELVQQYQDSYHLNPFYILEMDFHLQMGGGELTHESLLRSIMKNIEKKIELHPWEDPVRSKLEWMKEYVVNSKCSLENPADSFAFTL